MDWLLAMAYGAIGGAVVEAVVSSDRVLAWNNARHHALTEPGAALRPRPALSAYVDPLSDVAAGVTRILLGAVAGLVFHSQVTGAYAAIAVGCSAPTVLRQLGSARLSSALEVEVGAGRGDGQRVREHADAGRADAEHADAERADVERGDFRQAGVGRSDGEQGDVRHSDAEHAEGQRSTVGRADVRQAAVARSDVGHSDVEDPDAELEAHAGPAAEVREAPESVTPVGAAGATLTPMPEELA